MTHYRNNTTGELSDAPILALVAAKIKDLVAEVREEGGLTLYLKEQIELWCEMSGIEITAESLISKIGT
jgi:hypothetical protein